MRRLIALWIVLLVLPAPLRAQSEQTAASDEPPEAASAPTDTPDEPVSDETPGEPPPSEPAPRGEAASEAPSAAPESSSEEGGYRFTGRFHGEYQHRFVAMSNLPLEPLPRTDATRTGVLGQNAWGEQWLRLRGELALQPILRLYGETDLLWGIAYGDTAQGTDPAAWSRTTYGYPGLRLRQLYLEWLTPIGLIRAGQMGFSWGLGMVANDGNTPPPFGDYRYGDLVRRVLFATRPAGRDSPFTVAIAGDWVAWDLLADYDRRGDLAFQGVLAAYYEENDNTIGGFVAYRSQTNALGDSLDVFLADLYARWYFDEASGGRIFLAAEVAYARGATTMFRSTHFPVQDVEQLMGIAQIGRRDRHLEIVLEGGYASGDSNTEDAMQRRGTMDPDHHVGLILFPEVIAWQTARAAYLAESPDLFARAARGTALVPTNGGVAGAYYFFPYAIWRPFDWIDFRLGAVLGFSPTDVVDVYAQRALSRAVNYRGGDPTRRDLGLELDGAVLLHGPLAEGVTLSGGVEGGAFLPGHAFDDANGVTMGSMGLLRLRLGLAY